MSALDPLQIAALEASNGKKGFAFFWRTSGKTLIALTEFSFLQSQGVVDRMIVVCPNSFKGGWMDEIEKHGFQFDIHIWQSVKKTRHSPTFMNLGYHSKGPPVLIINFDAARMPGVLRALCIWAARGKAYLAIDESIQIKGHATAQTKAMHTLAPVCAFTRLLRVRPQSQGPHDLWGQLRAIGVFQLTIFFSFRGHFCIMVAERTSKSWRPHQNRQASRRSWRPSFSRPREKDWLPCCRARTTPSATSAMSAEQQHRYKQMEHQFLLEIESGVITRRGSPSPNTPSSLRSNADLSMMKTASFTNSSRRRRIRD